MRLGARMLKTGIAVVLSLYICEWFDLQPVLLVVIAAVLTTQPSVYRSFRFFIDQVQANAIGALLGFVGVKMLGTDPIVVGLIVVVVIIISLLMKLDSSISLAIVTVIAVMSEPDTALNRVFLILIGVMLSMIVNALVMPPNHEKNIFLKIKSLNERVFLLLRNVADGEFDEKMFRNEKKELYQELKKADELFELYREERNLSRKQTAFVKKGKVVIFKRMLEALHQEMHIIDTYRRQGKPSLDQEIKENITTLAHYHETITLKYEGKIKMKYPHERNANVFREHKELLESLFINAKGDVTQVQALVIVASLAELTQTLDRLDTLVTNFLMNHRVNKDKAKKVNTTKEKE